MKRFLSVFLSIAVLSVFCMVGCGVPEEVPEQAKFEYFSANPVSDISLAVGQKYALTPRVSADEYTLSVVSDNISVVRVSDQTLVGVAEGKAEVTVKASDGTNESSGRIRVAVTERSEEDLGAIDLYLVAGQSNAVGCSSFDASALDEQSLNGFSNVLYTGLTNDVAFKVMYRSWQNVKAGLGQSEKYIGPELGIAQKISSVYNSESDKTAGIIKIGVGGSNLLDTEDLVTGKMQFLNQIMGNWVSPSMEKGKEPVSKNNFTGGLYRAFINGVYNAVEALYAPEYSSAVVRALYWMQGESDRETPEQYKEAFKLFLSDVKNDLSNKLDTDLSDLPVLIGEISETFDSASEESVAINQKFIAMQRSLASELRGVSICANAAFKLNEWDKENGKNIVVGTDNCHWAFEDAITIGNNVGEWILSLID